MNYGTASHGQMHGMVQVQGSPQPPPLNTPGAVHVAKLARRKRIGGVLVSGPLLPAQHGPRVPKALRKGRRAAKAAGLSRGRRGRSGALAFAKGNFLAFAARKLRQMLKMKGTPDFRNHGFTGSGRGGRTGFAGMR